jgi:hypothetical protein
LTASGGTFSNGILGTNPLNGPATFISFTGNYTIAASSRGTGTFNLGFETINFAFYIVSPSSSPAVEIFFPSKKRDR